MGYKPPVYRSSSFSCPHCGALAHQNWSTAYLLPENADDFVEAKHYSMAECFSCENYSLWYGQKLVYPLTNSATLAPLPNPDLPDEVKVDYEEARTIASLSPRGAAALLRLAIQRLCRHLGERGKNLNDDIAALVQKGLDVRVQQALDVVRVIGNDAVHPGHMNLNDDPERAHVLFFLVNEIANEMISKPKRLQELYDQLPERDRQNIAKRDAKPT